jgi:hypothetical protein
MSSFTEVYFSSINEHESQWGVQNNKERFMNMYIQSLTGVLKLSWRGMNKTVW